MRDRAGGLDSAAISYLRRSVTHEYLNEGTGQGPLLWRGEVPGRYLVRGAILKAPEDFIKVELQHEHPHRGEVDISVAWTLPGGFPEGAEDFLAGRAWALLALLNLRLEECLTPVAPLQIAEQISSSRRFDNRVSVQVRKRHDLSPEQIGGVLQDFRKIALDTNANAKLCTALELYGAHFAEASTKVRFLLLVMSLETLTEPTEKDRVALDLLDRWSEDLDAEKRACDAGSLAHDSLLALERELFFRRHDSIRSQVRKLMGKIPAAAENDLSRRALKVYDKRSLLVHDGSLPSEELAELEPEALKLVEAALTFFTSFDSGQEGAQGTSDGSAKC